MCSDIRCAQWAMGEGLMLLQYTEKETNYIRNDGRNNYNYYVLSIIILNHFEATNGKEFEQNEIRKHR